MKKCVVGPVRTFKLCFDKLKRNFKKEIFAAVSRFYDGVAFR